MAKDAKEHDEEIIEEEEGAQTSPAKKKLIIIILAALVVLLGAGGGIWWYLHKTVNSGEEAADAKEKAKADDDKPVYEALETFVVNLQDAGVFLQVNISFKVADEKVDEKVKLKMPEIKDKILFILSTKEAGPLGTAEGKKQLSNEILVATNKILGAKSPKEGVEAVLFSSFIIQ